MIWRAAPAVLGAPAGRSALADQAEDVQVSVAVEHTAGKERMGEAAARLLGVLSRERGRFLRFAESRVGADAEDEQRGRPSIPRPLSPPLRPRRALRRRLPARLLGLHLRRRLKPSAWHVPPVA